MIENLKEFSLEKGPYYLRKKTIENSGNEEILDIPVFENAINYSNSFRG